MRVYRHYGQDKFLPELGDRSLYPVRNREMKPTCCLWASPLDSSYNWYNFCVDRDWYVHTLDKYFDFVLADWSRIYVVNSTDDFRRFLEMFPGPEITEDVRKFYLPGRSIHDLGPDLAIFPDYTKALEKYDGIEVNMSKDYSLYWWMNTWDVDSIAIWNYDVVDVIS